MDSTSERFHYLSRTPFPYLALLSPSPEASAAGESFAKVMKGANSGIVP